MGKDRLPRSSPRSPAAATKIPSLSWPHPRATCATQELPAKVRVSVAKSPAMMELSP